MIRKVFEYHPDNESLHEKDVVLVLSFTLKGLQLIAYSSDEKIMLGLEDFSSDVSSENVATGQEFTSHLNKFIQRFGSVSDCHVIMNSGVFAPVPDELFDESRVSELLDFVYPDHSSFDNNYNFSLINTVPEKFYLIYRFLKWQSDLLQIIQHEKKIHCDIITFFNSVISSDSFPSGTFVNVGTNYFDVVVLNKKSLLFMNRFSFATSKDFCYHLIGAMKSIGLNVFDETVHLSGEILPGSEISALLGKYVAAIRFMNPENVSVPESLHAHRYFYQLSVL